MQPPATTTAGHVRAILTLGLPLIGSNLAQFAINMTDTVMLGWYDVTALAAATIANSFYFVTFIVGAGFAAAVVPMVAASAEAGDDVQVRRVTRMGLWAVVLYGLIFTLPFMWSAPILRAFGQAPEVAQQAQAYLRIAAWAMIPALMVMVLKGFLSALERTSVILWVTVGTAVLNGFLDYALIFGNWGAPEMGIRGAAVASLILVAISMLVLFAYALRTLPQYSLLQRWWRPDGQAFGQVFRLGLPIGITSLAEGGLFVASAVMMGWIGKIPLAAHGIAIQLASLTFMFHVGLSQAATVRAGRALGRRDEAGLRRGGIIAIALSLGFAALTMAAFLLFPTALVDLFIDPAEPERAALLAVGVVLLAMAGLFQLVDAAQVMALGLLRGVQDTARPMALAALSYWVVGMPVSYTLGFPLGLGAVGIWSGLVIGLICAAALLMWRFWTRSVRIGGPGQLGSAGALV